MKYNKIQIHHDRYRVKRFTAIRPKFALYRRSRTAAVGQRMDLLRDAEA